MNEIYYSYDQLKELSKVGWRLKCGHCGTEIWVASETEHEAKTIARTHGWRIGSRGCYCAEHRSVKLRREEEEDIRELTGKTPLEWYEKVRRIKGGKYGKKDN